MTAPNDRPQGRHPQGLSIGLVLVVVFAVVIAAYVAFGLG